ncbi:MAG: hypothetical protein AAF566_12155, partial [Pseudomonadota bacterium]
MSWKRAILVVVMLGLGPAVAQDDDGGGFLERTLEDALSGEGRDVAITGFEGALSSNARLQTMTFSDADGTWLRIEDAELVWNRAALLRGRVEVTRLQAAEIDFRRPPLPSDQAPSAEAPGFSLPELPVSVSIQALSAPLVTLGPGLLGREAMLSVEGSLGLANGEGSGEFLAERVDGAAGRFEMSGTYSNASDVLGINVSLEEAQGGLVAALIGLPGEPALALQISGTGPLSDFAADLAMATDGVDRVTGAFALTETAPDARAFSLDLEGDVAPLVFPQYRAFFGPDITLALQGERRADSSVALEELSLVASQVRIDGDAEIAAGGVPERMRLSGEIAAADGAPVVLPIPGDTVQIAGAEITLGFDASLGEDWQGEITIRELERGDLRAENMALMGAGRIRGGEDARVTARLDVTAEGLDVSDAGAQAALGEDVSSLVEIAWNRGEAVEIPRIRLDGQSYSLNGRATIRGSENGPEINATGRIAARELSVFSGLAGRQLRGAADAEISAEMAPAAGIYSISLNGTTENLAVDVDQLDALLAGQAEISAGVRRDSTGSHIEGLRAKSEGAEIEGSARLTNADVDAFLELRLLRPDVIAPDV